MQNFSIFTRSLLLLSLALPVTAQSEKENTVAVAALTDKMSANDLREWYSVYKGVYLWGDKLDFVEANDMETVFSRMRLIRDKLMPEKGNDTFAKEVNSILKKYEESSFTSDDKSQMIDDLEYISNGIKLALEKTDE